MKLLYIVNIRLPTEKAHGLQIVQNCEAFAEAGADVTLWIARRVNSLHGDVWAHYGVRRNFALRRLPSIDLLPLVPDRTDALARLVYGLQLISFLVVVLLHALFTRADIYYTRDERVVVLLSLIRRRRRIAYEVHTLIEGRIGHAIQRQAVRRAGRIFALTAKLRDDLIALGAQANHVTVARDGIRSERFAHVPDQAAARRTLGWPEDSFVVGYVGRLQTLAMDKGVGVLVETLARVGGCTLALVGGPDDIAQDLRQRWCDLGQDEAHFLYAGQVAPDRVPLYLSAFDVCALPSPWTTFFAYYASPIKLFEYMAARRAILASALPSVAEVVADGESALLAPPGDVEALAAAVRRLRDDPALRQRLADKAYILAMEQYTWDARARMILDALSVPG